MAQHDYVIDNQASASARADLNSLFQAIASQNSGATAPTTTYANMIWYDTANDLLKMRNEANSAWITLGTLDQALNTFTAPSVNGKTVGTLTAAGGIAYATSTSALAAIGAGTAGQILLSGGAGAPTWSNFSVIDYQAFIASGTWTKPAGISANSVVIVEMWGGGGGGSRAGGATGSVSGGGGGGSYAARSILASSLASTVSVTVGAGGAGATGDYTAGSVGSASIFAGFLQTYGGGAGTCPNTSSARGGNGAGLDAIGTWGGVGFNNPTSGGSTAGTDGIFWGGGGGGASATAAYNGYFGGGGGGGSGGSGGTSLWGGGSGGAGNQTGAGTAGGVRGGGGGAGRTGNGGAGGRGEVRVWTIG